MGMQNGGNPNLGAGPMAKHRVYYKGEGGGFPLIVYFGFPQVRAMVNLVSSCLPMVRPCTKSVIIMH